MATDRKKLIIDAATKSFSMFGYKATTMDQIARIADVGKGTIYTFFENKEELFKEIVQSMIDEMTNEVNSLIQPDKGFTENLHLVVYHFLKYRREHQLMAKIFHELEEMRTPAVQEMVRTIEEAMIAFIAKRIENAIEKKYIKNCDPEVVAYIILKFYINLIVDWEKNRKPLEKEEIAELFELLFIKGLAYTEK